MKRASLLVITLLLFASLGVIVVAQMPDDAERFSGLAQARLGEYINGEYWSGTAKVERAARAHKPWLFEKEWGSGVSGDGVRFHTADGSPVLGSLRFPPDQLWCVLLKRVEPAPGDRPYAVVFVGLHIDMYNADWLVHRATDDLASPELLEALSRLDCDLGLADVGPRSVDPE
jgi:hypothetical protein